ncbi:ribosome recycling factor [Streptomyces sp. NPDC048663]|uniref:ribosome recycling factor n=1 Tax=Streptomyces sp. NPDC048663 TaxID=3155638 RepID=UPI003441B424
MGQDRAQARGIRRQLGHGFDSRRFPAPALSDRSGSPSPFVWVIKPWDRGMLQEIERAVCEADLGVSVLAADGIVRLDGRKLTEQERANAVKQVRELGDAARTAVDRAVAADGQHHAAKWHHLIEEKVAMKEKEIAV